MLIGRFERQKQVLRYLLLMTMQMQTPTAAIQIRPEIIGTITVGSIKELECCDPGLSGIMSGRTTSESSKLVVRY